MYRFWGAIGLLLWLLGSGCRSLQVPADALVMPVGVQEAMAPPLMVSWRHDLEAAPSRALVAGRILLVTNRKGEVRAFELPAGRGRGVLDLGRDLLGMPVLKDALLMVPVALDDVSIVAYDLYRRRVVWRRGGEGMEAGLVLVGDVVYGVERWGRVYALQVQNGQLQWVQEPEVTGLEGVRARPAHVGTLLVVADKRGRVVALEVASGRLLWHQQLWPIYADLAAEGSRVLVSTTRGRMVALEAPSGVILWQLALPDTSVQFTAPVVHGSTVYVAGGDGVVRALALTSGASRWIYADSAAIAAPPVADPTAGVLYVGDLQGRLLALDLLTGGLRWETRLKGGIVDLKASPFGLVVLARPRHVYLLQPHHEEVATHP